MPAVFPSRGVADNEESRPHGYTTTSSFNPFGPASAGCATGYLASTFSRPASKIKLGRTRHREACYVECLSVADLREPDAIVLFGVSFSRFSTILQILISGRAWSRVYSCWMTCLLFSPNYRCIIAFFYGSFCSYAFEGEFRPWRAEVGCVCVTLESILFLSHRSF